MYTHTAHFSEKELNCKCDLCKSEVTHKMDTQVLVNIESMRVKLGRPLIITSAYRCENHPVESKKSKPGQHALGKAVDFKVSNGAEAFEVIKEALLHQCTGFAYGNGFVHVDWRESTPVTWKY
jgi:zinc D-Ala-D-Ala carboxypeptidase